MPPRGIAIFNCLINSDFDIEKEKSEFIFFLKYINVKAPPTNPAPSTENILPQ